MDYPETYLKDAPEKMTGKRCRELIDLIVDYVIDDEDNEGDEEEIVFSLLLMGFKAEELIAIYGFDKSIVNKIKKDERIKGLYR